MEATPQQIKANQILLDRVLPTLQATAITQTNETDFNYNDALLELAKLMKNPDIQEKLGSIGIDFTVDKPKLKVIDSNG